MSRRAGMTSQSLVSEGNVTKGASLVTRRIRGPRNLSLAAANCCTAVCGPYITEGRDSPSGHSLDRSSAANRGAVSVLVPTVFALAKFGQLAQNLRQRWKPRF
jgi:hypothetical protein